MNPYEFTKYDKYDWYDRSISTYENKYYKDYIDLPLSDKTLDQLLKELEQPDPEYIPSGFTVLSRREIVL